MSIPSKQELQRLFGDESLATDIRAAEASLSWPALRILQYLANNDTVTTGKIARQLNMEMTEVRDYLDVLEELTVVSETDTGWTLTTTRIQVSVGLDEDFSLSYALDGEHIEPAKESQETVSWWQRWLPWLKH